MKKLLIISLLASASCYAADYGCNIFEDRCTERNLRGDRWVETRQAPRDDFDFYLKSRALDIEETRLHLQQYEMQQRMRNRYDDEED